MFSSLTIAAAIASHARPPRANPGRRILLVAAAVVLKPGAHVTPVELRDHVNAQVAAYKYPRVVWITDALPKGPSGKIVKREIEVPPSVLRR